MKITIKNRLNVILLETKIKSATGFARAMTALGYKLSTSQAARYINEDPPPAMNIQFIQTACNLFQCLPSDLFDILLVLEPDEQINPLLAIPQNTKRLVATPPLPAQQNSVATPQETPKPSAVDLAAAPKQKLPWEDKYGVAGPTVTPFPSPKKNE